ncbi:MAG: hypothetical protein Ta2B_21560 [Termitinemataceae bacterium]|nr:MAG: hypothetical protein Ta2B_21560 [Termitinemataceae bacterium]
MAHLKNFNTFSAMTEKVEAHRGTQRENTGEEKIAKSCILCVPPFTPC